MTNRLLLFAGALLLAVTSGGWIHGSRGYANWHDALEAIPCDKVDKVGNH